MGIHHTQLKKAEKAGVTLKETETGHIEAFWPKRGLLIVADSVSDVMKEVQAAQALENSGIRFLPTYDNTKATVLDESGQVLQNSPMLISRAHELITKGKAEWAYPEGEESPPPVADAPDVPEPVATAPTPAAPVRAPRPEPVGDPPEDGAEAYRLGFSAADCPFSSENEDEYDAFVQWNEEWDEAADAEEEPISGSVVKDEYRARYAEMGHPTHCGDWLANFLNERCIADKAGTDITRFESICNANGVSLAKYNRTNRGWQGRIRMTGRNLLKAVVVRQGYIMVPNMDGLLDKYEADPEWLEAKAPKGKASAQTAEAA